MIKKHYVLITKNSCHYCQGAIELLKECNASFVYTDMENAPGILDSTKEQLAWYTVPIIWEQDIEWEDENPVVKENNFVGGFSELRDLFDDGE